MKVDSEELEKMKEIAEAKILKAIIQFEKAAGIRIDKISLYKSRSTEGRRGVDFDISY